MDDEIKGFIATILIGVGIGFFGRPSLEKIINKPKPEATIQISETHSGFSEEQRKKMFDEGIGIPFMIRHSNKRIEYWKGDHPDNLKKVGYYQLCVEGKYNSKSMGQNSISSEEAKVLLRVYGWD